MAEHGEQFCVIDGNSHKSTFDISKHHLESCWEFCSHTRFTQQVYKAMYNMTAIYCKTCTVGMIQSHNSNGLNLCFGLVRKMRVSRLSREVWLDIVSLNHFPFSKQVKLTCL